MIKARDFQQALGLECLVSSSYDTWDILSPELNRPGMQFCGFYDFLLRLQLVFVHQTAGISQLKRFFLHLDVQQLQMSFFYLFLDLAYSKQLFKLQCTSLVLIIII